jgi:hypothetical protein
MNVYRYPMGRILADYFLGGSGAAMSGALLALAPTSGFVIVTFGGLTGLFLLFTMRTGLRQRLRIAADGEGIRLTGGLVRSLRWDEVEGVTLRYYSTRRSRKGGWMTLTLRGSRGRISVDSHLDGFEALARRAGQEANRRHLTLDPSTQGNFAALDMALENLAS